MFFWPLACTCEELSTPFGHKSLRNFNLRPLATTCRFVWPGLKRSVFRRSFLLIIYVLAKNGWSQVARWKEDHRFHQIQLEVDFGRQLEKNTQENNKEIDSPDEQDVPLHDLGNQPSKCQLNSKIVFWVPLVTGKRYGKNCWIRVLKNSNSQTILTRRKLTFDNASWHKQYLPLF